MAGRFLAARGYFPWPLEGVDQFFVDTAFEGRSIPPDISRIALIAIDDASLTAYGQFPWPRSRYVPLLDRLTSARVVLMDILFAEPDARDPQGDWALAEALRRHGRVILAAHLLDPSSPGYVSRDLHARLDLWAKRAYEPPPDMPPPPPGSVVTSALLVPPVLPLLDAAAGIGLVQVTPDSDGVYRHAALAYPATDGRIYPHVSLEVARLLGVPPEQMIAGYPDGIGVGDRRLPLDAGEIWINYAGPMGTFPTYSFREVAEGRIDPSEFADKIVLVGATARGLAESDIRPGPFRSQGRICYGVETNANIIRSVLFAPPLRGVPLVFVLIVSLVLGAAAGAAAYLAREALAPVVGVALVAAILGGFYGLFLMGWVAEARTPLLAVVAPMAYGLSHRLLAEAQEKRQIRQQFSVFVSPEVANLIAKNPDKFTVGGERREVTLLFSDVRGFTSISEGSDPEDLVHQLNEYFSPMAGAIMDHQGVVDKFMGDGIMALFGPFYEDSDHASNAVRAALDMLRILPRLNEFWRRVGRPEFRIGIGVHTGEAIVGNMGSNNRMQYTASGDAVNIASRIEGLTKDFGVSLLMSQATAERVSSWLALEEMGEAPLQGRTQAVRLFTPTRTRQEQDKTATEAGQERDI